MKNYLNNMTAYTAIAAGFFALAYAYFFIVAKDPTMYSLFLLLLGLASLEVMVGLYSRLKGIHEVLAQIAVTFGVVGSAGMAMHAGFDLANAINAPAMLNADLPSQVDPRGLLTFGFTGLAVLKIAWMMNMNRNFPEGLSLLGLLSGALLIIIYLARLVVMSPENPLLLYPVLLNGFIVGPLWYVWLGKVLLKK